MITIKPRIIEGGAILDQDDMSMEEYSARAKKMMEREYKEMVRTIVNKIDPPNGARVLEIGPGPSWITIWLALERPDITIDGLEASADMIRTAMKNVQDARVDGRVRFINGIVEDMKGIPDATYDLVYSHESMHHWTDPLAGLKQISRVLRTDGKVCIEDSRRDLGIGGMFIVNILGPLLAGSWLKHWKASIAASYTPPEVDAMLRQVNRPDWHVVPNLMGFTIEKVARSGSRVSP